jgi:hypothetical protein
MVGPHNAIVIANSQHRRQSMTTLLRSLPEIGEVFESDSAYHLKTDLYFHPSLILIDGWLVEKITPEQINPLRRKFPHARILALVKQNHYLTEISTADASLVEGFSVEQFFQTVSSLINNLIPVV